MFVSSLLDISVVMGQLGYIAYGPIRFYVFELPCFFVAIYELITMYRKGSLPYKHPLFWWFMWILIGWVVTASTATLVENIVSFAYIARLGNLLLLTRYIYRTQYNLEATYIFLVPYLCIIQYLLFPDLRHLQMIGWDPHMYRSVGLLLDPPVTGSILGLLWISILIKFHPAIGTSRLRASVVATSIVLLVSIICLKSRSTYLAFCIVTPFLFYRVQKLRYGVILVVLLLACIYTNPSIAPASMDLESDKVARVSTIRSRYIEMKEGLEAFGSSPILGIGYNRVAQHKSMIRIDQAQSNHASGAFHSFWITQLATTGLVGIILLCSWLLKVIRERNELIYPFLWISIIGVFDNVVFHPLVVTSLLILFLKRHKTQI